MSILIIFVYILGLVFILLYEEMLVDLRTTEEFVYLEFNDNSKLPLNFSFETYKIKLLSCFPVNCDVWRGRVLQINIQYFIPVSV